MASTPSPPHQHVLLSTCAQVCGLSAQVQPHRGGPPEVSEMRPTPRRRCVPLPPGFAAVSGQLGPRLCFQCGYVKSTCVDEAATLGLDDGRAALHQGLASHCKQLIWLTSCTFQCVQGRAGGPAERVPSGPGAVWARALVQVCKSLKAIFGRRFFQTQLWHVHSRRRAPLY